MKKTPLIKEIQKGLLAWYDFKDGSRILYIGSKGDAVSDWLLMGTGEEYDASGRKTGAGRLVTIAPLAKSIEDAFLKENEKKFDYIVCISHLEKEVDPKAVLRAWSGMLTGSGIMLLGFNNRLGIRFFCGDRDPYTERNFDGIEHYRRAYNRKEDIFMGRMYARSELDGMLESCGLNNNRFYSVYSDLQNPTHLFAYGFMPREDVTNRIFPSYFSPSTIFLEEEALYPTMIDNDLFHVMANAYLIEASPFAEAVLSSALQVTATMERSSEDAMLTIIFENSSVEKRNAYPEGRKRFEKMIDNMKDLLEHGLKVVPMELTDKGLRMPFVDAPSGQLYLRNLLQSDPERFLAALDSFYSLILQSSDKILEDRGDGMGATLKYGYPDLVPLNSFYVDGEFVFFDQEFRIDSYPANVMAVRMISMLYFGNPEFEKIIPQKSLYERYKLSDRFGEWKQMEGRFLNPLRNEGELREYRRSIRRDPGIVNSNRQRMNYSEADYYRLFVDIFSNADTRKLILFGSGRFTERFLELYGKDYPPFAIIDNREDKWGQDLEGVEIKGPSFFNEMSRGEYKVIICIKNYVSVMKQLDELGVREYSVFDPNKDYPRKRHPISLPEPGERKKFHVGYVSGTFDLFHVGHLNLFKRAKEQCDYLIVGVVTDKGTIRHKGVAPFVPFEERIELVRSCRFVDEAVEIPVDANGPKEAFSMYHFDVMFQGTDHINEPYWIDAQNWLRERGSDMVFFPYTLSTNSTNIKALIEKKLM